MNQVVASQLRDVERAEMELVLAALAHTPRLEKFLRYIAERYFQNRVSEINEYNIATEVLGRSKSSFDASRDSIARVEAHRLRKRLKAYYENEGKGHEIQVSLPQGSYVPSFIRRDSSGQMTYIPEARVDDDKVDNLTSELVAKAEKKQISSESDIVETTHVSQRDHRKGILVYTIAGIAALLVVSFGAAESLRERKEAICWAPLRYARPSQLNFPRRMQLRFRYACLLVTMERQGSTARACIGRLIAIFRVVEHSSARMSRWHEPVIRCCLNIGEQATSSTTFPWRQAPTSYTCTLWLRRRMIPRAVSLM